MRRLAICAAAALAAAAAGEARAAGTLQVGFCAKTVTSAAAPFAVADKMGWFGDFTVELVPLAGSADCVKQIGAGGLHYALPSIEPVANLRPQGIKAKDFYTAYQGNTYAIAVPANSPIKDFKALKGKRIGVASTASGGYYVAKAIAANYGFADDVTITAIGEGAQVAALLRTGQVDALGLYDTQYAIIQELGVPLRIMANKEFDRFPGNGFIALEDYLEAHHAEAAALGRGYAKGTIFTIANPAAAVKILWQQFPQTKATGKDEATALKDDVTTLEARIVNFRLTKAGVKQWGESSPGNFQAYLDFLLKWGVVKQPTKAADVTTNELIPAINDFDVAAIAAEAKKAK